MLGGKSYGSCLLAGFSHTNAASMHTAHLRHERIPPIGRPSVRAWAAERIQVLLYTLDKFKGCFNEDGQRNAEGHRIYADHFAGAKAWFSDSSDTEKSVFRKALTFPHPAEPGKPLFCTWHGKVKSPQIRIHFSWPVRSDTPLYVVYVGPKRTEQ